MQYFIAVGRGPNVVSLVSPLKQRVTKESYARSLCDSDSVTPSTKSFPILR